MIGALLATPLGRWATAGAAAALVAVGAYWWGYSAGYGDARLEAAQAAAKAYKETRDRIDNATDIDVTSPDALDRLLRELAGEQ